MKKALTLFALCLLLLLTPLTNTVRAQELEETSKRIDILPWEGYEVETNNIAGSNFTKEPDILGLDINFDGGTYWGPFAESSLFEFEMQGGSYDFNSTFNFTHQDIINGCSRFTVRIPIKYVETEYQYAIFYIFDNTTKNFTVFTNVDHDIPYITIGEKGIYFTNPVLLLPERQYIFGFKATLTDLARPQLYLTMEKYQVTETKINFWNFVNRDEQPKGSYWPEIWKFPQGRPIIYDVYEKLPNIFPAWAIIFHEGIGDNGLFGLHLQFGTKNTNSTFGLEFNELIIDEAIFPGNETPTTGFNFSLYIPFISKDSELVDWVITLAVKTDGGPGTATTFKNPIGGATSTTISFYVNNTNEFLLVSCPWYLYGDQDITSINITLIPDKDLTLLCNIREYKNIRFLFHTPYYLYYDELNHVFPYENSYDTQIGLFAVYEFTDGQWAEITPSRNTVKYNFGWGNGFIFPGSTTIYFFLNNDTNVFIDGKISDLSNIVTGEPEERTEFSTLLSAIRSIPGTVVGYMRFLWDKIVSLGTWIKGLFLGFADWLLSVIGEIKDVLTTLVKSMGISLGFFVILMIQTMATGKAQTTSRDIKMQLGRFKQPIEVAKKSRITRASKELEKAEVEKAKAKAEVRKLEEERKSPEERGLTKEKRRIK